MPNNNEPRTQIKLSPIKKLRSNAPVNFCDVSRNTMMNVSELEKPDRNCPVGQYEFPPSGALD